MPALAISDSEMLSMDSVNTLPKSPAAQFLMPTHPVYAIDDRRHPCRAIAALVIAGLCSVGGCNGLGRPPQSLREQPHTESRIAMSERKSADRAFVPLPPVEPAAEIAATSIASDATLVQASWQPTQETPVAASSEGFTEGVTLDDVLALAFANNPAIRELAATTQIAAGYRTQVGLYSNPILGYQGQQLADAGTDQHLVFVEQQIITANKLQLNRAVLNETLRSQLKELEAQKLRVATDIKTVYYDCVRIQHQLTAIEEFSTLLSQGLDAAEKRMKAGEASKIDYLQTEIQLKQIELDRRQLAASLAARRRELVALAGVPNTDLPAIRGELPATPSVQDWKAIEEELVASSPELEAAQARIRQAMAAIRRQEVQAVPNLGVQFGAGVDQGTNSGMMNVQVGAPIPVYNKNQGNIAAARAEYCRAVQEAQRIDNAIRARLAAASGEYMRAAAAVSMYADDLLPAASESLELAEQAYRVGEQEFIQLLVTRRTFFDTNLNYIAAKAQLAIAQAQIDGYLLTGALNSVINNSGSDAVRGQAFSQQ